MECGQNDIGTPLRARFLVPAHIRSLNPGERKLEVCTDPLGMRSFRRAWDSNPPKPFPATLFKAVRLPWRVQNDPS
jgi:hypothetical protein